MKSPSLVAGGRSTDFTPCGLPELVLVSGPKRDAIRLCQVDRLGRRLNRWRAATRRYARRLEFVKGGAEREFWVNRFLRAATKAGRASTNYYDRMEAGLSPLTGPCFGEWCVPPIQRTSH